MEDNKKDNTYVLSNKENVPEKPSYEQLKYWLDKAISDNKNLVGQLNEVTHVLNFLPYLFKVVELHKDFTPDFVEQCKTAIVSILTPVKKSDTTSETLSNSEDTEKNKEE